MRDRSTHVDLALAFAATFVMTLALWPQSAPRQIIHCDMGSQGWKSFSIAVDDPSLAELKDKVRRWSTPELNPQYLTAKWQMEVAEFYQSSRPSKPSDAESTESLDDQPAETSLRAPATARISDTVTTASYEFESDSGPGSALESAPESDPGSASMAGMKTDGRAGHVAQASLIETTEVDSELGAPSDADYWSTVKAAALKSMKSIEDRSQQVPVVFERVTRLSWPALTFHVAFLLGLVAACGYMHWLRLRPLAPGVAFGKQPVGVFARIGAFTGVNLFALCCALALLID